MLDRKEKQHVAWGVERPDGGRGFGFTGGHFHKGWANDDQRKLVLNAILWTAKVEVPAQGVPSKVTPEEMEANLDDKGQRKKKEGAAVPAGNPNVKPIASTKTVHADPAELKADLKGAKELFLVTTDAGDSFQCDWSVWIEPTLIKADGSKIKLTELKPKFRKVGWGKFAINARPDGQKPITVKGKQAAFGVGAHAPSIAA